MIHSESRETAQTK